MSLFGNFGDFYKKKDHIKYADDYADDLYEDENGKTRRRVTYIGPYIPIRNEVRSLRMIIAGILVLTVLTIAAVVSAMLINHTSAWWFFTSVPMTGAAFPCLYLVMGTLHLPYSGKPIQRDAYMHGIVRMFRSCGAIIVLTAITLLSEFVFRIIKKDWMFLSGDKLFLALLAGIILACLGIIFLLRMIDADEVDLIVSGKTE